LHVNELPNDYQASNMSARRRCDIGRQRRDNAEAARRTART
jgi:hypothetical protein